VFNTETIGGDKKVKYTFKCPACQKPMIVEAENDEEAVNKLMAEGKKHGEEVHPDMKTDPAEMVKMVKDQMTKEG